MEYVSKLILSCRTTEINGAADRIIMKYDEGDWSFDTHLTEYFNSLKEENAKLKTAINYSKAESDLEAKDELRDEGVRGINHMLAACLKFANVEMKTAAVNVDNVFKKYGVEIVKDSYVTESSLINSMLEDFSTSEMQAEIAKLPGLSILIAELTTAQNNFETARVAFETAMANEGTKESATKLKQAVGIIFNENIVGYLNVMAKLDAAKYKEFALAVGTIIKDTNEQIKKRRNKIEPETDVEQ